MPSRAADQLLDYCKSKKRICPMPMYWNRLYSMLPNKKFDGTNWQPASPLILAAWDNSSVDDKRHRLQEHILWADDHDAIFVIDGYLRGLSNDQWYYERR
jgi:hypothetical protein